MTLRIARVGSSFVAAYTGTISPSYRSLSRSSLCAVTLISGSSPARVTRPATKRRSPGGELAEEILAAEPLRFDDAGVVAQRCGDERKAALALLHAQHAADDDRFAFAQRGDGHRLAPVAVRARDVREQIGGRLDADLGELRGRLRTDARERR